MKRARFVAYGGILTGVSVVLLLVASISPGACWALCISAGTLPAIPLVHRQVRLGLHIYFATSLLAFLVVPGKRFAVAYFVLFGVYPLIKYGIERLHNLPIEWACKLLYAGAVAAFLLFLLRFGVLPLDEHAAALPHALLTAAFFIAFACYDILFSKIIALFRILFRNRL